MNNTISSAREECHAWGIETINDGKIETDAVFYNLADALAHGRTLKMVNRERFVRLIRIKKYIYDDRVFQLPCVHLPSIRE
jgi:hypothetical protein